MAGQGQELMNKLFGTTPENPVKLPVQPIPFEVTFSKEAKELLIGMVLIISAAGILISFITSKK